ncbi:uncharacterized protein LOC143036247 [Oratosquilla oratoria]|uniref:uncharacterized protein LOC143036247 n=1 Tax=Oratosquilla oratoria TaxID=337810 RepID=UPI003F75855A
MFVKITFTLALVGAVLAAPSVPQYGYTPPPTYQYPHYEPAPYHPTPAPYRPTPAPYHPTPAPYHPTPAPYHPTPAPYHPTPSYTPPPTYQDSPKYDFNYAVKHDYSGNDFGHQETRDGYNTQGSYSVLLPDGRLQTVTYTVNGDSGYVAQVTYEGEAQYPHYEPAPYHPTPAPYRPTPAPYHPSPAPYHPTPAPYHPTPAPYHPTPSRYH